MNSLDDNVNYSELVKQAQLGCQDSMWVDSYPDATNTPPPIDGYQCNWGIPAASKDKQIGTFCMNRHEGFINGVFLDFSVRKIGLKELWKLK